MNLVLLDFDGTITTKEIFTRFVLTSTHPFRLLMGGLLISPAILLYKAGLLPAPVMRPIVAKVAFAGASEARVEARAQRFVAEHIPTVVRKNMLETIAQHKAKGDRVIVVSASLSPYLKIWCKEMGIELICSELVCRNGRYTGAYLHGDCSKENKVANINRYLELSEYPHIIAYGDSEEDYAMLNLAHTRYLRGKQYSPSGI